MSSLSSMSSSGSGEKDVSTCTSANVTRRFCLASLVSLADAKIDTGVTLLTGRGRVGDGEDGGDVSEDEVVDCSGSDAAAGGEGSSGLGSTETVEAASASLLAITASCSISTGSLATGGRTVVVVVVVDVGGGGGGGFLAAATAATAHLSTMSKILLSFNTVLLVMGRLFKTESIWR